MSRRYHQIHCLTMFSSALRYGVESPEHSERFPQHVQHCLNYVRQMILCAARTDLEPMDLVNSEEKEGADGLGVVHTCVDWHAIANELESNNRQYN